MAIYSPPKESNLGSIMSTSGNAAMAVGGTLAATGIGAIPGLVIAGVGALGSIAGNIIDSSSKAKRSNYEEQYKALVQGENNLNTSIYNNSLNKDAYNKAGINSSIKNINQMLEPMSAKSKVAGNAGTSIIDNRLV